MLGPRGKISHLHWHVGNRPYDELQKLGNRITVIHLCSVRAYYNEGQKSTTVPTA